MMGGEVGLEVGDGWVWSGCMEWMVYVVYRSGMYHESYTHTRYL